MRKCKIGIIGFGTVGKGIYRILKSKNDYHPILNNIEIVGIAVKNINKKRGIELEKKLLVNDPYELIDDPNVDVIVEVMGGTDIAKDIILKSLKARKSVVTANKAVIARYGSEIYATAAKYGVYVLTEATVCGGIPIIEPLKRTLKSNQINKMVGIINGTTNFILTKMTNEKADYKETLRLAQNLGFAEFDPTSDVEGHDAADKISILTELAFGGKINRDSISTQGIEKINIKDIEYANKLGFEIKLLAFSERNHINNKDSLSLNVWVAPSLIPKSHPLATVGGVNNAILIEASPLGKIMLYGPGAGSGPTASAVVSDILTLHSSLSKNIPSIDPLLSSNYWRDCCIVDFNQISKKNYLRIICLDTPGVIGKIGDLFGKNDVSIESIVQLDASENKAEIVVITHEVSNSKFEKSKKEINALSEVELIASQYSCI